MALPTHVDLFEPGNGLIRGTLEVNGGVTVKGSAIALAPGVAGDGDEGLTINESLSVGENAAIGGTLGVTGATTLADLAAGKTTLTTTTGIAQLKLTPDSALTAAPVAGAHQAGEILLDKNGAIYVCITSGTPGTWKTITVS